MAYYQINKKYIAANLCENRAKPKSKCNGKCYLAKKIKAQEDSTGKLPSLLKEITEVLLFQGNTTVSLEEPRIAFQAQIGYSGYHFSYLPTTGKSIFQPPKIA